MRRLRKARRRRFAMRWREIQAGFAKAVRNPGEAVPEAVSHSTGGQAAAKRFSVYRNNHALSLIDALASRFSVVERMVGPQFFQGMARSYVQEHIPRSPVLTDYGSAFPEFVDAFPAAGRLPFLGDTARLEWFIGEAYHAADAAPMPLTGLAELPESALTSRALPCHPSLRLLKSRWPVFTLWRAHQDDQSAPDLNKLDWTGECGLAIRPRLQVDVVKLTAEAFAFIEALHAGAPLSEAAERCGVTNEADFANLLQFTFGLGVVAILPENSAE